MDPGAAHPAEPPVRCERPAYRPGRPRLRGAGGGQLTALDVGTGELDTVTPPGSGLIAPDDLDFGAGGDLYATEYYDGQVSVRGTDGRIHDYLEIKGILGYAP